MSTAGQASIWFAFGLALLAPGLMRLVTAVIEVPLRRIAGASGYLTVQNVRQRADQLGGALMPIILFTASPLARCTCKASRAR